MLRRSRRYEGARLRNRNDEKPMNVEIFGSNGMNGLTNVLVFVHLLG